METDETRMIVLAYYILRVCGVCVCVCVCVYTYYFHLAQVEIGMYPQACILLHLQVLHQHP